MDPACSHPRDAPDPAAAADTGTPGSEQPPARSRNASARAVLQNALSGYVTLLLGALTGFVTTPIILHGLGVERYGIWSILIAMVGYIALLDLGLGTATTNRVAAAEHDGAGPLSVVVSSTLALMCVIGAVALVLTGVLSLLLPHLYHVGPPYRSQATIAFLLVGSGGVVSTVGNVYTAFLLGTGRMYLVNFAGAGISIAVSIVQAVSAATGAPLPILAAWQAIGAILTVLVLRTQTRRAFPGVTVSLRVGSRAMARRLLSIGLRNAVSAVAGTLAFGSDLVIVGLIISPKAAAAYAIALRGATFIQRVTTGVGGALGPSHAYRAAAESDEQRFRLFCTSIYITLVLAIFTAGSTGTFAHGALRLWLGHYPSRAAPILVVFCVTTVVSSLAVNAYTLLISSERADMVMRLTVLSASVNLVFSVLLTLLVGVIGPALGSLIAASTVDLIVFPRQACKLLGQTYRRMIREAITPLLLPTAALALTLCAGRLVVSSGILIGAPVAIGGAIYFALIWRSREGASLRARLRHREGVVSAEA